MINKLILVQSREFAAENIKKLKNKVLYRTESGPL
jgi:hypothetical protein